LKLFLNHKIWWLCLLIATIIVSAITSQSITFTGMLTSIAGHFAFSLVLALFPLLVYYLIGKPLNTEQFMATVTFSWLVLAAANLAVMP